VEDLSKPRTPDEDVPGRRRSVEVVKKPWTEQAIRPVPPLPVRNALPQHRQCSPLEKSSHNEPSEHDASILPAHADFQNMDAPFAEGEMRQLEEALTRCV
jgi:hypothetical protein